MSRIEAISNGLGGPSMLMLAMMCDGKLPARLSITADTGGENDRLVNSGERCTAQEFFDREVLPRAKSAGMEAAFVRTVNPDGTLKVGLWEHLEQHDGGSAALHIPMFGSEGGRFKQTCTDNWKIRAIRQELRRRGAKSARSAQGLHYGEAARRVKGEFISDNDGWSTYYDTTGKKKDGKPKITKWSTHYYPLVDLRLYREDIERELQRRGVPYLVTSECDFCPHKDLPRWERTSPETLIQIERLEAKFEGRFFFTSKLVPLRQAIAQMRIDDKLKSLQREINPTLWHNDPDFGCGNGVCGV